MDCSLDDIVREYLKKVKCDKTSKMFGTDHSVGSDHSKSLTKFMKNLRQSEIKKENRAEDDLGFEINFGAFQPEPKVRFLQQLTGESNLILDGSEKTFDQKDKGAQESTRKSRKRGSKRFYRKDYKSGNER